MAETTAALLVDTLIDWGIDTIYGLPGDSFINTVGEEYLRQAV
jgi:thiamine pyrophosphate-dependent acetolactate synthase large subunit-like protein